MNTISLTEPHLEQFVNEVERLTSDLGASEGADETVQTIHDNISAAWHGFVDTRIAPVVEDKKLPETLTDEYKSLIVSPQDERQTRPLQVLESLFFCSERVISSSQAVAFAGSLAIIGNKLPHNNLGRDIKWSIQRNRNILFTQLSFMRKDPYPFATWAHYDRFVRLERLSRTSIPSKSAEDTVNDFLRSMNTNVTNVVMLTRLIGSRSLALQTSVDQVR